MSDIQDIEKLLREAGPIYDTGRLWSAITRVVNEHGAAFAAIKGWAALLDIEKDKVAERDARIAVLEKALRDHNNACQDLCGRGDQEAMRCKYRPYFEANGRRCPECPTDWIIEIPDSALAQQEKP